MDDLAVVAHAAALLSDPLRLHLLGELENGVLTVSALTARLQVAQPRVSAQLALLRKAGWVTVETHGRQRYYRLTSPQINVAILELAATPAPLVEAPARATEVSGGVEPALRTARRCYDHLAGVVGVRLCDHFLRQGWLVPTNEGIGRYQPAYRLTEAGTRAFEDRGVPTVAPPGNRRRFAYACPDWTEAHPHLGGVLAAQLFLRLQETGLLRRHAGSRAVDVGDELERWLAGSSTQAPL